MSADIIRQYYAAFNAGDWEAMTALLAEDVAHDLNQGRREVGRAAFAAFLARMARSYRERIEDLVVMVGDDGRCAAEWVVHGEYLATDEGLPPARGQRYRIAGGSFFEVRDGKIARVTNYYNVQDWIRQATAG